MEIVNLDSDNPANATDAVGPTGGGGAGGFGARATHGGSGQIYIYRLLIGL